MAQLNADVVVPNANEALDAISANRFPLLVNGGMRYQQVYDASQFGTLAPSGEFITGMLFRPDSVDADSFSLTINNVTFN